MRNESAWLEARRNGLGASDIARIFQGHGYEVWAEKRGLTEDWAGNGYTQTGKDLEPIIARRYSEKTGLVVHYGDSLAGVLDLCGVPYEDYGDGLIIVRHAAIPWMACSTDAICRTDGAEPGDEGWWNLQIKCSEGWQERDWADGAPEKFRVQIEAELAVLTSHGMHLEGNRLAVQHGYDASRLQSYVYPTDPAMRARILEVGANLWAMVESGDEPPADWNSIHAFNALHPQEEGKVVDLGADAGELLDALAASDNELKALKEAADERKAALRAMLGDAEVGVLPDGRRVTYRANSKGVRALKRLEAKP